MTIETSSPIAIAGVTNNGGHAQFNTSPAHGLVGTVTVTVDGCRDASGNLVTGYNTTASVVVDSPTQFTNHTAAFVSGGGTYSYGGGVWPAGAEVTSGTLSGMDAKLPLRVTDKTGDTVSGTVTVLASPGVLASDPTSSILTNSPGAVIQTTGGGVKYILGDGDDVLLKPTRTRTIVLSSAEAFTEYSSGGDRASWKVGGFGIVDDSAGSTAPQTFWIPLSRLHDNATLLSVTLLFFPGVSTAFTNVPTITPSIQVFRLNPSTDVALTSLTANGEAFFPPPASAASYMKTPAIGASGSVLPTFTLLGVSVSIAAGLLLEDSTGNVYTTTAGANYSSGDPVPVTAVAPAAPATFFGGNTNHSPGDVLSWVSAPAGLGPTVTVAAGGLTGGINGGYAQKLVYTPDPGLAVIDQSTYVYVAKVTDDNLAISNSLVGLGTQYTGLVLDFGGIVAMTPQ